VAKVQAAAHVLANHEQLDRAGVQRAYTRVLRDIGVSKRHCGTLDAALTHFLKVTRSYRPGLFHCYDDPSIPQTNNDLEHCFGQHRLHERRATGRKTGVPYAVLHGPARVVAGVATRLRPYTADALQLRDHAAWRRVRQSIRQRFALRAQGQRFRRDPNAYLAQLEADFLKRSLPA
jgi:hypothetical protein